MEEAKISKSKEGRKKTTAIIGGGGGGGIGGVVLLGGALAAATLFAAFTIKRSSTSSSSSSSSREKPSISNKDQKPVSTDMCKKNNESEGLRSLLQTSSPSLLLNPRNGRSISEGTQIGSLQLISTQSLFLEEKPVLELEINGEKEILVGGDEEFLPSDTNSKPGNFPSFDNYSINVKEIALPVVQLEQVMNTNDSGEDTPYVEAIEVKKEDEACDTILAEQVEENPPMQLIEEEESTEDEEGEYVAEESEESSEGVRDSSMESIAESIWPAESVERLEINFQNSGEKIDNAPWIEIIEVREQNPPKKSVVDDDNDDEGENVLELGEESLEETGDACMESIAEPVWQKESTERLKINFQNSGEKIEHTTSVESIEVKKEDEAGEIVHAEHVKEDPAMQLIDEQDYENEEGGYVVEKCKDRSEGTNDSLMESKEDPTTQSIEEHDSEEEEEEEEEEEDADDSLMESEEDPTMQAIEEQDSEEEEEDDDSLMESEEYPTMQSIEDGEEEEVDDSLRESEEDPTMQSIEKQVSEEEKHEGGYGIEKGEDSFEGTGDFLMEFEEDPKMQSVEEEEDDGFLTESEEDPQSIEEEDDDSLMESEENPPTQSIEGQYGEEEEEEEGGGYVVEKGEDSSEGTGDSSMESNAELIWPTESIERLSLEFKEMEFNFQNSGKKVEDEDRRIKKEEDSYNSSNENSNAHELGNNPRENPRKSMTISSKKGTSELVMANDQSPYSGKWRVWIWSVLVLVLALLLLPLSLTHLETMVQYLLKGTD